MAYFIFQLIGSGKSENYSGLPQNKTGPNDISILYLREVGLCCNLLTTIWKPHG